MAERANTTRAIREGGGTPLANRYHPAMRPLAVSLVPIAVCAAGCASFDPPPSASIVGEKDGVLPTADVLTVAFTEPVVPETLRLRLAKFATDGEGNLADEDTDDKTELEVLFARDPGAADTGGASELSAD